MTGGYIFKIKEFLHVLCSFLNPNRRFLKNIKGAAFYRLRKFTAEQITNKIYATRNICTKRGLCNFTYLFAANCPGSESVAANFPDPTGGWFTLCACVRRDWFTYVLMPRKVGRADIGQF